MAEPGRFPPGVDLAQLAGLVAQLLAPQLADAEQLAERCAAEVAAQFQPVLDSILAAQQAIVAAQQVQRRPPPAPFPPAGYGAPN